jgi:hypothetical protein
VKIVKSSFSVAPGSDAFFSSAKLKKNCAKLLKNQIQNSKKMPTALTAPNVTKL